MNKNEIIFCENPMEELIKHISKHGETLLPIEVEKRAIFSIRIGKEFFENLPENIIEELLTHSEEPHHEFRHLQKSEYSCIEKSELHYNTHNKSYIFHFLSVKIFTLKYDCKYGYDGLERSFDLYFMRRDEYPKFIIDNIGLNEKENPIMNIEIYVVCPNCEHGWFWKTEDIETEDELICKCGRPYTITPSFWKVTSGWKPRIVNDKENS